MNILFWFVFKVDNIFPGVLQKVGGLGALLLYLNGNESYIGGSSLYIISRVPETQAWVFTAIALWLISSGFGSWRGIALGAQGKGLLLCTWSVNVLRLEFQLTCFCVLGSMALWTLAALSVQHRTCCPPVSAPPLALYSLFPTVSVSMDSPLFTLWNS